MSETVANVAAMVARVRRAMPDDLVGKVSPKFLAEHCQIAWDNGWRDPGWLVKGGLAGTQMPNVVNASAMFTAQFRDACAERCPVEQTPTPPRELDRAPGWNPPATESQRAHWLDVARAGLVAARTGQQAPSWVPDADDPWEVGA